MKENEFINKLYINPIESIKLNRRILRKFRIKERKSEEEGEKDLIESLPDLKNGITGSLVMQNWNTKINIPEDIGYCLNYPVIIDRTKFQRSLDHLSILPNVKTNFEYGKAKIKERGEHLLLSGQNQSRFNTVAGSRYQTTDTSEDHKNIVKTKDRVSIVSRHVLTEENEQQQQQLQLHQKEKEQEEQLVPVSQSQQISQIAPKPSPYDLVDFSTFTKHLYLRDNNFLYLKRVGGPTDFILCSYKDIKKPAYKFKTISKKNMKRKVEYITMSKNTVLHYQKGLPYVYSVQEWIDNYEKYKRLLNIDLFRNFKSAKLFDLWRRFFKKTKRNFYTEKLKKKFQRIDENLLQGILETRNIIKSMEEYNIFEMDGYKPQLVHNFKNNHKKKLIEINDKIESYRNQIKEVIKDACIQSYKTYKKSKCITLDDEVHTPGSNGNEDNQDNNSANGHNIQNFLKDAIPYAQDATRKSHYKKLLRYIRSIDFIFNEAKYTVVNNSLEFLQNKFKRLYEAYIHQWLNHPIIIAVILCYQGQVLYNPPIQNLKEVVFDNFIQEKIYTVIYKKNFLEPQEFPNYMTCFEEVFDCTVDQNANLNNRIRDSDEIKEKYSVIKKYFDNCHQELEDYTQVLRPTLINYDTYMQIDFDRLEINSTPTELKEYLEKFTEESKVIRKLKKIVNIGIFQFDITFFIDMVIDAPMTWLKKIRIVIPKVLVSKLSKIIEKLNGFIKSLSINPVDVERFIKLKKAVEECQKQREKTEDENNDISDLITLVNSDREIKLQDYDTKLIIELKNANVTYERKYDSMTYFIDNNIKNFRNDLKNQIKKFDADIKGMISELNTDTLNNYQEETFQPISALEDKSIQISKAIFMKKSYQTLEDDLEIEELDRSNFENLDNLKYDYDLKVQMWNSVKDFQDMSRMWNGTQVIAVDIPKITKQIDQWIDLCKVGMVDLDFPNVPKELLKRIMVYKDMIVVLIAIQNKNVTEIDYLLLQLKKYLGISYELNNVMFTFEKLIYLPNVPIHRLDIIELNNQGNEEKRIKDTADVLCDSFYSRRMPFKLNAQLGEKADKFYISARDADTEYEFIEKNIMIIAKLFLCRYCNVIKDRLIKLNNDFMKYRTFLDTYTSYQKYLERSDGIIHNGEFGKENPADHKKLVNENLVKVLYKILKDNLIVSRFIENGCDKIMSFLNNLIQSFESNYKAISQYLDKRRREFPRFFLLSDQEMAVIYSFKETNEFKQYILIKLFPFIKEIDLGNEIDEFLTITTTDDEKFQFKNTKSGRAIKDYVEIIESGINRKIKDIFRSFRKELEASTRPKSNKKPKDVIFELIGNKENLAQTTFNSLHSFMIDSVEKALISEEEAFDRLFDLYSESKEERKEKYISMLKDPNTNTLQKRILINMISLENYYINTIEILIREDVSRTTDYYFQKIINTKIENDNYVIKVLNIVLDYGFEYVGLQNNFVMVPESERMFVTFANCIQSHQPLMSYGISENGTKEIYQIIAGLLGKSIVYVNTTREFGVEGFNNVLYANLKTGGWICLDRAENISFELLSTLALRIVEVIRLIKGSEEDSCLTEMGEKYLVNFKSLNIFFNRIISPSLMNQYQTSKEIPNIIKDHFRLASCNLFDYQHYINITLLNLGLDEPNSIARKIMFIIQLISHKVQATKSQFQPMIIFNKLHRHLLESADKFTSDNELALIRQCFHKALYSMFTIEESEEFSKYTNEILKTPEFDHKAQSIGTEEANEDLDQCISSLLTKFKFNNTNYETKIRNLFYSMNSHHSFLVIGPSLTGKTRALNILKETYHVLNSINSAKYPLLFSATVFPKSMDQSRLFAINKVETAHQMNNNFFDNLISLFDVENYKELETLNLHDFTQDNEEDNDANDNISPSISPTRLASKIKMNMKKEKEEEELFQPEEEKDVEEKNMINSLIFDGQIDPTWMEYINSIYDQQYALTRPNGKPLLTKQWKLFFETNSVQHASPSFLTRQFVVSLTYETFSWENILYSWVETNKKITANDSLRNYIRGLFENFFPKIWDFVLNNKLPCVPMTENYALKNLLAIFDALLPMFNFDEKIIGRRQFNVIPKIELIKKSTLSIFIYSCAWTMLFFSNFVIKTKIEKLISDIFKADDLKGPIFDYFINESTNDYDEWKNLMELPEFREPELDPEKTFYHDNIFIHTTETVSYWWLCQKFITSNTKFLVHGKPSIGKTFLVSSLLKNYEQKTIDLKTLQILITTNTTSTQLEQFINDNTQHVKRNIIGDQFGRKMVLFVDDIHMSTKDSFGSSEINEYLRKISQTMSIYDNKKNIMKYLDKFSIAACCNFTNYPLDENNDRFINKFALVTYYISDASISNMFRVTLEFHLKKVIPNTSGITSAQYIQASLKLSELLKANITYEPTKLHINFDLRDVTKVMQAFHMFNYRGSNPSEYPDLLKKLFFYESTRVYEAKLVTARDITMYRKCICEAYSASFKQDKVTSDIIFNSNWDTSSSYLFQRDYFTQGSIETMFNESRQPMYDFIKEKLVTFYATAGIKNENMIMLSENNLQFALKILRILEGNNRNMVLIGKEYSGKESLFKLCSYIIGYDVIEVDEMWLKKSKEAFIKDILIGKVLINCTYTNRKTILFAKSKVLNDDYLLETITYFLNPNEIKSNFNFINNPTYGDLDETTLIQHIKDNLSVCITINHNCSYYRKLHIQYPSIIKHSNILYQKHFDKSLMKSLIGTELKEVISSNSLTPLTQAFLNIHSQAKELGKEYSKKLHFKLIISQKQFEQMISFYHMKYSHYKATLQSKEQTYSEALITIDKCEEAMAQLTKEIEDILPDKNDNDKQIEEKKKEIAMKTSEKSQWKMKRIEEEKPIAGLDGDKAEKENFLQAIFAPFKESLEKISNSVGRISSGDITEIKNAWDGHSFGKFVLGKIFELLGDNTEWDYIKKNIDVKVIKTFHSISPLKEPKELIRITSEIVSSPDFATGDKFQKPFKTCGVLCDYFACCQRYFNEINNQRDIIDEINDIKGKMAVINKKVKEYLGSIKDIENYITGLEKSIDQLDKKKSNFVSQIEKKENLKQVLNDFNLITKEKKPALTTKKMFITSILSYFDFYLLFIASYCIYSPPFNKSTRNKLQSFIYQQAQLFNIDDSKLKELMLSDLISVLLDSSGADKDFFTAISGFEEFYKENFMIMHLFKTKIPYIIDINRYSKNILTSFIQYKEMSSVVAIDYSSSDFLEKLDSAMRNGSVLIIEDCEEETYYRMRNFILFKEGINDKGRKTVEIDGLIKEKIAKFQLYFVKTKCDSLIHPKAWADMLVINFNCTKEIIHKQLFKYLIQEQDPRTYGLYTKARSDITKDKNKVIELEKKMLVTVNQIDVSGSVDKLQFNTSLLDQYRLENQTLALNVASLEGNKKRYGLLTYDLNRFKLFATDSGRIYKMISSFSTLEPLYCITLEYFSNVTRRFFKESYGLFKELSVVEDNQDDQRDRYEDEEEEEEEEKDRFKKKKTNKNINIPTYEKDSLLRLILYIYNEIIPIYSYEKRRNILLLLLFYYLKEKDEIPSNYKSVIGNVASIFFNNNIDKQNYNEKTPINCITRIQWNCLKQINDSSSYILSIIIDHMENNRSAWNSYLQKDAPSNEETQHFLKNNFKLFSEELEDTLNPFIKFILFSILHPEKSELLITTTIQSILTQNVTVPSLSLNSELYNPNNNMLLIIMPINTSFEESIGKDLQDIYYPKLVSESSNSIDLVYKEFTLKGELSPAEFELIHLGMKTGGMFIIKNAHLFQDTISRLCEEIKENKATIAESFKLLIIGTNKNSFNNSIIDNCIIINRDINLFRDIKEYIIDLVRTLPSEYFELFINRKGSNVLYPRKLLVGMIIISGLFLQYENYHCGIITVPIEYNRNDFYSIMQFISSYLNTIPEDKLSQMANIENILGFNYNSLITIAIDSYYSNRLIYKDDITRIEKVTQKIFDDEVILNENHYFAYHSFNIPSTNLNNDMTLDEFIQLFKDIPNEDYNLLIDNISKELIDNSFKENIQSFYALTHSIVEGTSIENRDKIIKVNMEVVKKRLTDFKQNMPDLLSSRDLHPQLFKLSKSNEYVNPLDDILDKEMNSFNNYLQLITNDINAVMKIIIGDMVYVDEYAEVIYKLSRNEVPMKWRKEEWFYNYHPVRDGNSNNNEDHTTLAQLSNIIANHVLTFTKWMKNGSLKVYPINQFNNLKLFFDTLHLHFIKSKPENTIEQIRLHFFLTNAKESKDLDETSIGNYKKRHGKDIVFCKGIQIINGVIDDKHILKLNSNDLSKSQHLPIFGITFSVDVLKDKKADDYDEEDYDEDYDDDDDYNEAQIEENKIEVQKDEENKIELQKDEDNKIELKKKEEKKKEELLEEEDDDSYERINVGFYNRYEIEEFNIKELIGSFNLKYLPQDNILNLKGVKITISNNEEEMAPPKIEIEEKEQESGNANDKKQEKAHE